MDTVTNTDRIENAEYWLDKYNVWENRKKQIVDLDNRDPTKDTEILDVDDSSANRDYPLCPVNTTSV
jgi:hypothetical protein